MSVLARVASALGFVRAPKMPAGSRGRVVPDLPIWNQTARIGGGLTPRDVTEILRQADTGYMWRLMDLANESRQKDCHLQAVLSVNDESLAGLPWQLVVPDGARAKDRRAAEWVEEKLRANPHLPRLIQHLAGAIYYAYSVAEILWVKDADGRLVPDEFAHLAPRRFGYRLGDGAFVWRDPWMPNDGIDFREQWPRKFIVSHPRVNGDVPQREGLCRVLIWAALFRNWAFTDWLRTAEMSWKPWRIGTYNKKDASPEDIDGLENVLSKLATTGWAVKSEADKIDIEWPQGTASSKATHSELCNTLANEMSKAALGQTETVQASASSGYAQAKVHQDLRKEIREGRARQISADVTRDLITSMIELNFSADTAVPQFRLLTDDALDVAAFAEAISTLANAGVRIPQKWVRDEAGVPEPEGDEPTIGGKPPTEPATEQPTPVPPQDPADAKEPAPAAA